MSKENIFDFKAKFRFARKLIRHRLQRQPRVCPYCGPSSSLRLIRRKKLIMDILQCETCHLIIRWPTDTATEHEVHYHDEFAVDAPQIAFPGPDELSVLVQNNFLASPLDFNHKIRVLKALRPAGRVLDFGCSWAYGTYQLQRHGFDATGFEISKPRAGFGRERLGQKVIDSLEELASLPPNSFDIVFFESCRRASPRHPQLALPAGRSAVEGRFRIPRVTELHREKSKIGILAEMDRRGSCHRPYDRLLRICHSPLRVAVSCIWFEPL